MQLVVPVREVAAAWTSDLLAVANNAEVVKLWHGTTGEFVRGLDGAAYSFGGRRLAITGDGAYVVCGSWERGLTTHAAVDGRLVWSRPDLKRVQHVAFTSDGHGVITCPDAGACLVLASRDGSTSRKLPRARGVRTFRATPAILQYHDAKPAIVRDADGAERFKIPTRAFSCVAAAASDAVLAFSEVGGSVRAFALASGLELWKFEPPPKTHVVRMEYSPSLGVFACWLFAYDGKPGQNGIVLLDVQNGRVHRVQGSEGFGAIEGFCQQGTLAIGSQGDLFELPSGRHYGRLCSAQEESYANRRRRQGATSW